MIYLGFLRQLILVIVLAVDLQRSLILTRSRRLSIRRIDEAEIVTSQNRVTSSACSVNVKCHDSFIMFNNNNKFEKSDKITSVMTIYGTFILPRPTEGRAV